jgi:hypothetical protein
MVNRCNISIEKRYYSSQNDPWVQKNITKQRIILSVGAALTCIDQGRGLPSLQLLVPVVAPRLTVDLLIPLKQ